MTIDISLCDGEDGEDGEEENRRAYGGPADGVLHEAGQVVRVAGRHLPELLEPDAVRLRLPAPQPVRADHTARAHTSSHKLCRRIHVFEIAESNSDQRATGAYESGNGITNLATSLQLLPALL